MQYQRKQAQQMALTTDHRQPTTSPRDEILHSLKIRLQQISSTKSPAGSPEDIVSTGITALDDLLPQRGLSKGGMVEWLIEDVGMGAATLALAGVRSALKSDSGRNGWWVVIDLQRQFFPPAALGWGVAPERLLLIHPASERDAAWAFEQALRCPGVAVTWNWIDSATERMLQRWKVAAEAGGGQGVLFRSDRALKQAAWVDVRWLVQPVAGHPLVTHSEAGRRLRLKLVYCRGALSGQQIELECDDETGHVRLVAQLADSMSHISAIRA
jgi:protein ImuA